MFIKLKWPQLLSNLFGPLVVKILRLEAVVGSGSDIYSGILLMFYFFAALTLVTHI